MQQVMSALPVFMARNVAGTPRKIKSDCAARVYGPKTLPQRMIGAAAD